jgi:hypothetical protein
MKQKQKPEEAMEKQYMRIAMAVANNLGKPEIAEDIWLDLINGDSVYTLADIDDITA